MSYFNTEVRGSYSLKLVAIKKQIKETLAAKPLLREGVFDTHLLPGSFQSLEMPSAAFGRWIGTFETIHFEPNEPRCSRNLKNEPRRSKLPKTMIESTRFVMHPGVCAAFAGKMPHPV